MMRRALFTTMGIVFAVALNCSRAENKNVAPASNASPTVTRNVEPIAASPAATPTGPPPVSRVKSLPPEGGDIPRPGEFDGYAYTYKKDETKTVATFSGKLLPTERDIMLGAVRDVIARSYRDKVASDLRLTGSGAEQSLRIASKRYQYVIVPTRGEAGEIISLIITQLSE